MMAKQLISLFFLLLAGCTTTVNPWQVDHITAGETSYDLARLTFVSPQPQPPFLFEMRKMGERLDAFLSLTRLRIHSKEGKTKVAFIIEEECFEEFIPVHEGNMRLQLPLGITNKVIEALQDGKKVAILLDDFEEVLEPDQFVKSFTKFNDEKFFFQNFLKGPTQ